MHTGLILLCKHAHSEFFQTFLYSRHDYKIVSMNRCVITCIFPSINDSWCSSNEDSEPKFCSKKNEKAHEMTVFSNLSASAEMNSDLEVGLNGSLVEDHKDGHAR